MASARAVPVALHLEERAAVAWLRYRQGLSPERAEATVRQWRRWPLLLQKEHPRLWAVASRASFAFFGALTKLFHRTARPATCVSWMGCDGDAAAVCVCV
jgi:hypothetical protein